jgi:hypothetical protein
MSYLPQALMKDSQKISKMLKNVKKWKNKISLDKVKRY